MTFKHAKKRATLNKQLRNVFANVDKQTTQIADAKDSQGNYLIECLTPVFLLNQLNRKTFDTLEQVFRACPFGIDLEEILVIFLQVFHHEKREQIYLVNAVVEIFNDIKSRQKFAEFLSWKDVTDFFMRSIIENDNRFYDNVFAKAPLEKITNRFKPDTVEMVKLFNIQPPVSVEVDNQELMGFLKSTAIDKMVHKEGITK